MKTLGPQKKQPKLVTLDTIEPGEVTWLWYPYIPIGTITALFGRGGAGKTHITCDIASRLSTGVSLPDADNGKIPQKVLMLSAEDDYSKVLVPRLIKMGADLHNIAVPSFQFVLDPWGIDQVSELMRDFSATVVFIDPIVYYSGGKMDINRSNEVRAMMQKLTLAAEAASCAVIVVGHTRKSTEGNDADSMMGSADWINASRSSLLVTETNDGTKLMKHVKANWGPRGEARTFTLDGDFSWTGTIDAQSILAKSTRGGQRKEVARAFIKTILANGPVPAAEVIKLAEDEGIAVATLNRAKIGIAISFYSRKNNTSMWRLATEDEE